ncbi:MAG: hypothetical protein ACTSXX_02235 [Candidatus Baldrarchaeia archaeon]
MREEDHKEISLTALIKDCLKIKTEYESADKLSPETLNKLSELAINLRTAAITYFKKYGVDPALTLMLIDPDVYPLVMYSAEKNQKAWTNSSTSSKRASHKS